MKQKSKGERNFFIILILVALAAIILEAISLNNKKIIPSSPKTETTSSAPTLINTEGWKTVTTKYWTFKIPGEWVVADCAEGTALYIGPALEKGQKIACGSEYPHPDTRLYISRQEGFDFPNHDDPEVRVEETHFQIGGQDAIKQKVYVSNRLLPIGEDSYYVKYEGALHTISLFGPSTKKEEFEAFVSTIKFNPKP
jgi:hypothetical protein